MRARPPWRIDVSELLEAPGTRRELGLAEPIERIIVGPSRTRDGRPIRLDGVLESSTGSVSLTGRLALEWFGQCRRCLEDVEGESVIDVAEVFAADHVEGETYPMQTGVIDILPLVVDVTGLSLPLTPLCSDECPGPLPTRFPVHREEDDDGSPRGDPRWAALDALRAETPADD